MERLPNRYPKISQSHKVPLYKGLSLFYPKLHKYFVLLMFFASILMKKTTLERYVIEQDKQLRLFQGLS